MKAIGRMQGSRAAVWITMLAMFGTRTVWAGDHVWTSLGPDGGSISALVIDPQNTRTVYEHISARIKELLTAVAERVVEAAARKRSWRVAVLQDLIDDSLALIAARKVMYADAKGEGRTIEVADAADEKAVDVAKVELRIERHRIAEAKKAALAARSAHS
jgi:hypothetical protein